MNKPCSIFPYLLICAFAVTADDPYLTMEECRTYKIWLEESCSTFAEMSTMDTLSWSFFLDVPDIPGTPPAEGKQENEVYWDRMKMFTDTYVVYHPYTKTRLVLTDTIPPVGSDLYSDLFNDHAEENRWRLMLQDRIWGLVTKEEIIRMKADNLVVHIEHSNGGYEIAVRPMLGKHDLVKGTFRGSGSTRRRFDLRGRLVVGKGSSSLRRSSRVFVLDCEGKHEYRIYHKGVSLR